MTILPLDDQLKIAGQICGTFSKKTDVSTDDLMTVALEKLPVIERNFIPALNDNYAAFLRRSLRGYLQNYVRDHSFTVKIPRRISEIYMKTRGYASFLIASIHTRWTEEEIREAHETINQYRSYNTNQLQSWNAKANAFSETNELSEAIALCREADVDTELLIKFFVEEAPIEDLKKQYGERILNKIGKHTRKLKRLAQQQGYNNYANSNN